MNVNQECFRTIKDFNNNSLFRKGNGKSGVYIWGFSLEETDFTIPTNSKMFFPYYVGKAHDMYSRTHEHIAFLSGGNFSIFDIKECVQKNTLVGQIQKKYQKTSSNAKPNSGISLPNDSYPNLLHFPEGIHTLQKFFTSQKIKNEIDWMLKHFCITYLIPEIPQKTHNIDLEKIVGNIIGYDKLITERYKFPQGHKIEIINSPQNISLNTYEDLFIHCRGKMLSVQLGI